MFLQNISTAVIQQRRLRLLIVLIVVIVISIYSTFRDGFAPRTVLNLDELVHMDFYQNVTDSLQAQAAIHRFITSTQYTCALRPRYGNKGDGGYEICQDLPYTLSKNSCIIYSFGSNNEFSFEDAVYGDFNCEIHIFDPSVNSPAYERKPRMYFHPIGISNSDDEVTVGKGTWKMMTVQSIMKLLKHDKIDVIKMDIEGFEWPVVENMIRSGAIRNIKQLLVEFHTIKKKGSVMEFKDYMDMLRLLNYLDQNDFKHYLYHTNNDCSAVFPVMTSTQANQLKDLSCYEIFYVNIKPSLTRNSWFDWPFKI